MRSLVLVHADSRQVVQAPWHVLLFGKDHDKADFVYRFVMDCFDFRSYIIKLLMEHSFFSDNDLQ